MKIAIRVDVSLQVGTGHLMRCLALAQGFKDKGCDIVFISYSGNERLLKKIKKENYKLYLLREFGDIEETRSILEREKCKWVVLDGYHFTSDYQRAIKEMGHRLLVIDDYAHLDHYCADLVLNQNYSAESFSYSAELYARFLLGTRYVLLRREFIEYKNYKRQIPDVAKKVLITMGGVDPDNYTLKVLKAVTSIVVSLEVKVVIGASNSHYKSIKEEAIGSSHDIEILMAVGDMAPLMAWADVAVSAGGTTIWEMAFMGLPALLCIVAKNQEDSVNALVREGFPSAGWIQSTNVDNLRGLLEQLLYNKNLRKALVEKSRKIVDGNGTNRVVERILPTNLRLRNARWDDCELIFQWANDPVVRMVSFHSYSIPWEEHKRWFNYKLGDPNCVFLIVTTSVGKNIGQVRFDMKNGIAVISVSIGREFREYGWGSRLIWQACEKLFTERDVECVHALIKKNNVSSLRTFENAGFKKVSETENHGVPAILMKYGKKPTNDDTDRD